MSMSATPLAEVPLADLLARLAGAVGGAAISVAYVLPRGRREAALRFFTGVTAGVIFGPVAGLHLAARLGLAGQMGPQETALSGAAVVSLCAWWALGVMARIAARWSSPDL